MSNWLQSMPSVEAYWLDKVIYDLHHRPDDLARYHRDPGAYLDDYRLTERARAAFLANDVAALYLCGVNPYLLRAHCIGMKIPEAVSVGALKALAGQAGKARG
jgi:protocatechuate 4,5-dioxygenase alpha chain